MGLRSTGVDLCPKPRWALVSLSLTAALAGACAQILGVGGLEGCPGAGGAGAAGSTTTTGSGGKSTGGSGGASACGGPSDAPPTACFVSPGVCTGLQCAYSLAPSGTACSAGTCDGKGNCTSPSDGGSDGGACTEPCDVPPSDCYLQQGFCSGAECKYTALSAGTACAGGTCDGVGTCVPCGGPCTSPPVCHVEPGACAAGSCTYEQAPAGTPCPGGGACDPNGSCQQATGASSSSSGGCGGCTTPTSDCYAVPGACGGVSCTYTPLSPGVTCNGGLCDGAGSCLPCGGPCTSPPNDCFVSPGACAANQVSCAYPYQPQGTACTGATGPGECNGAGQCTCAGGCAIPPQCHVGPGQCIGTSCTYSPVANGSPCPGGICLSGNCMMGSSSASSSSG